MQSANAFGDVDIVAYVIVVPSMFVVTMLAAIRRGPVAAGA